MRQKPDPLDSALQSLRRQQWPGEAPDPQIREKLMQAFESNRSVSRLGHHRLLIMILAFLVVASAGFAAVGGVDMVRSWFVTTEINGQVIDARAVVPDENGVARFTIPPVPIDGEGQAEISMTIEGAAAGEGEMTTVNVSMVGDEDGTHVEIKPEPEPAQDDD